MPSRLRQRVVSLPLNAKLLVPLLLVGLIVGLTGAWFVRRTFEGQLNDHMNRRGESIARALDTMIRSVLRDPDVPASAAALQRIVADMGDLPDMRLIVVVSGDPQRVVAATREDWLGRTITELPYARVQEDLYDAIETRRMHPHFHWETLEYDVSWPLALTRDERPHGEPIDGAIMLHLDARPVRAQLNRAAQETILALLAAIVVVIGLAYFLLDRLILSPLVRIEHAMDRRAEGDPEAAAPRLAPDEIGRLAETLNGMLAALDRTDSQLREARDTLEQQVQARTAELAQTNVQLSEELQERRRAERALRESHEQLRQSDRLATIGTLAAGVAHDLNNLLLPMRSRLRVLEAGADSDDQREQIADLKQTSQFLQELADSMRLCALDPDDEEATDARTNVGDWWPQVSGLLTRALKSRHAGRDAALDAEIEPGLPPVAVPSHRLTQAALNLIVNAGDACAATAEPRVAVKAAGAEDGSRVELSVSDNGAGMPASVVDRCCDPFFTTKPRGASTGLGLAMVRAVAEAAGGSLRIDSAPDEGTRITLSFPAVAPRSGDGAANRHAPTDHAPRAAVSLSDDRLAAFASSVLTSRGYHVARTSPRDPGEADVWLTEADDESLEAAHAFVGADRRRRLIVVGAMNEGWASLGAVSLGLSFDGDGLKEALRDADGDA